MAPSQSSQLQQLVYIRVLITVFFVLATLGWVALFHLEPVLLSVAVVLALMGLLVVLSALRLRIGFPVTETELAVHLALDALLYAAFLALTGGGTNPLVFVLLIPLIVSATTLSERATLVLSVLLVSVYTGLLNWYWPLESIRAADGQADKSRFMTLHLLGMWINFLLAVGIIDFFVMRMQRLLKARDAQLHSEREKRIRDQQLLTLATVTAGTAHELGTPLSTMRVVLNDLREDNPHLHGDLELLEQEVERCAGKLRAIRDHMRSDDPAPVPVTQLLERVLSEWQLIRPQANWCLDVAEQRVVPRVRAGVALEQALLNLLNNAADAGNDEPINIRLEWTGERIRLILRDHGPGISSQVMSTMGEPFVSGKGSLGIGLFLTTSTLRQQDGDVRLYNHPDGGTVTEIELEPETDDE